MGILETITLLEGIATLASQAMVLAPKIEAMVTSHPGISSDDKVLLLARIAAAKSAVMGG